MQKPSVKNIILIAAAAAIIGGALIVSAHENTTYTASIENDSQSNPQLPTITASASSTDSSIDYAGNWENTLSTSVAGAWGTTASSSAISSSTSLTPTDVFGRNLFSLYAQAQSSGQDVSDPSVQQAIVGKVLSDGTVLSTPKLYTLNDLKISPDNSITALTAYGNAAGTPYVENFIKHEGELTILQDSLNNNNPAELQQLAPIIAEYQGMLQGELTVTVPSSLENFHLDLVNAFSELVFADQSFQKTYSDGLTSLNGLNAYKQGSSDLNTALNGIESDLDISNITYTVQQPGVIFTYKSQ